MRSSDDSHVDFYLLVAACVLLIIGLLSRGQRAKEQQPVEPQGEQYGYTPDPDGTARFLKELDAPLFKDAAADVIQKRKNVDTFLYRAAVEGYRKQYGKEWVVEKQGIGDCVSWAWAHCAWIASSIDWQQGKIADPPLFPSTEAIYGGSRCEARNRDYAGYSDGSYGAAAARWLVDWGVLYRKDYGSVSLINYSADRAKDWGAYGCGGRGDNGQLDMVAREHPATSVALVTTFEQAAAAIESGFPVAVCSGVGFSKTRDRDGFCKATTRWAHAMTFCSVRYDRPGLLCLNSWGPNWVSGPRWPDDQPEGSFWVDRDTVNRMLGDWEDSFAVGGVEGFKWRDLHHGEWLGGENSE